MPRDKEIDFIWISLTILFFALAGFHTYLAVTSNLQVKVPERKVLSNGEASPRQGDSLALVHRLNQEMASVLNSFISSYNQNSRLAHVFGACGYIVAGITCLFCLVVKKKSSE